MLDMKHGIKPWHFTFPKTIRFIKSNDGYKYLILKYTDKENNEMMEEFREIRNEIKYLIVQEDDDAY